MIIAIWTAQILLGLLFLASGILKTFQYEKAKQKMLWVNDVPKSMTIFIGLCEILGGAAMLLPFPEEFMFVKPVAAIGILMIMMLAAAFHAKRGENKSSLLNVAIMGLVCFIVFAHWTHIVGRLPG